MCLSKPKDRIVATVGLQGHGKTVFLASLLWECYDKLAENLKPFHVMAASPKADEVFHANAERFGQLELPKATPLMKSEPAILKFTNVPHAKSQQRSEIRLIFYDIAGEPFTDDRMTNDYAPFLKEATDIIFLFDPTDKGFSAWLPSRIVDRVKREVANIERKNLIITLTKMDELCAHDEWDCIIGHPLHDDPPSLSNLPAYFQQMNLLSETLRTLWWLNPERQAQNLINSLPLNTRFCAISSLGHQPVKDENGGLRLTGKPEPFRVRDPLFWIFRAAGVM
ncbi:MAG: hypothetical protein MOB07_29230 [Acidobacteria bacterium]|nr:hypothetical protein [Acidobacteriota bacterium]